MGVMTCSRLGCDAIMCNRYSSKYRHLCSTCFDELIAIGVEANITDFMDSEPRPVDDDMAFERFDKEFPLI